MKEKIIENGIEYVKDGDYYIPNLKAPEGKFNIGKYAYCAERMISDLKI